MIYVYWYIGIAFISLVVAGVFFTDYDRNGDMRWSDNGGQFWCALVWPITFVVIGIAYGGVLFARGCWYIQRTIRAIGAAAKESKCNS